MHRDTNDAAASLPLRRSPHTNLIPQFRVARQHSFLPSYVMKSTQAALIYSHMNCPPYTCGQSQTVCNHNVDGSHLCATHTYGSNRSLAMQIYPLTSLLGLLVKHFFLKKCASPRLPPDRCQFEVGAKGNQPTCSFTEQSEGFPLGAEDPLMIRRCKWC